MYNTTFGTQYRYNISHQCSQPLQDQVMRIAQIRIFCRGVVTSLVGIQNPTYTY